MMTCRYVAPGAGARIDGQRANLSGKDVEHIRVQRRVAFVIREIDVGTKLTEHLGKCQRELDMDG